MNASDKGQVSNNAAEIYQEFFVPALFQPWTGPVADAAGVQAGQKVLDVACGTGSNPSYPRPARQRLTLAAVLGIYSSVRLL